MPREDCGCFYPFQGNHHDAVTHLSGIKLRCVVYICEASGIFLKFSKLNHAVRFSQLERSVIPDCVLRGYQFAEHLVW